MLEEDRVYLQSEEEDLGGVTEHALFQHYDDYT